MSAPTSPNSSRFAPNSAEIELFDFDGSEELWQSWSEGLRPDPLLNVSEWADQHRWLSPRASAEPGRYRTDRTPYMRAIMDTLSPSHPARRVVLRNTGMKGLPREVPLDSVIMHSGTWYKPDGRNFGSKSRD